ncbi:hypothetical protein Fbal_0987 [Ferrimonas balearica DSM 9799]|uniref:Alpha/beta hydrolase n=1 Tax=Ferrimonas balearica (strain DSM 9799 / CCM 4581 / KCTC 23876 / PAT) TaxID=550540 RepID=E1SU49_FERBD|nr:hypothetical protein [Ferrimonas balearica]ADN75196.1 hypothetical protein Fbal_0987 [Ferrimonas balearica DSM 9799]
MLRALIPALLLLLSGCTALVEQHLSKPVPVLGDYIEFKSSTDSFFRVEQWCQETQCLPLLHWPMLLSDGERLPQITMSLNGASQILSMPEPRADAPKALLIGGHSTDLMASGFYAMWLTSLGFDCTALAGPSQSDPFDFGLTNARLAAQWLASQPATEQPTLVVSISMGVIPAVELIRHSDRPTRLLAIAPMGDFATATASSVGYVPVPWYAHLVPTASLREAAQNLAEQSGHSGINGQTWLHRSPAPYFALYSDRDPLAPAPAEPASNERVLSGLHHLELALGPLIKVQRAAEPFLKQHFGLDIAHEPPSASASP